MSEYKNDEVVTEEEAPVEEPAAAVEAVEAEPAVEAAEIETVDTEDAPADAEDDADEAADEAVEPEVNRDEQLMDKAQKAARLLRSRKFELGHEAEAKAERVADLKRAIKLLELKPKMEQKEMAELLGMRLRMLDSLLAEAEENDIVGRIKNEENDMRSVVVFADEGAVERVDEFATKQEPLVPGLDDEELDAVLASLDKIIDPLVDMGLDRDRGPRDERGPRGDRGGRGGFGDRGPRGGFGDRGDRGPRGGFGDRGGDRGPRGGFGDRGPRGGHDDRGGRGGFGDRPRGGRPHGNFGPRNDRDNRNGGRNGGGFKGNRGNFRG